MNLGLTEMIFLFILGLLLFGPKKLPEIGRKLGKAMAEFKRASNEFQSQLNDEVRKLEIENIGVEDHSKLIVPPSGTAARGGVENPDREIVITDTDALSEPERQNG
ncbi:MAG TPA: twin-arginine translocase TatA/TatE family subunit [Terriglobales bacterium]|nr:twin-arginine translocase TatA/TatE family subunit [Terriglobales bacterium]